MGWAGFDYSCGNNAAPASWKTIASVEANALIGQGKCIRIHG
jgi:hypothetical protein